LEFYCLPIFQIMKHLDYNVYPIYTSLVLDTVVHYHQLRLIVHNS
jgi:hypothetical protein